MAIQLEKSLGSYDTEDFRTKENHCCFEVCALCLSSTMESARLRASLIQSVLKGTLEDSNP